MCFSFLQDYKQCLIVLEKHLLNPAFCLCKCGGSPGTFDSMRKILQQLNREVGVKGSMVISPDGLVIMAELGEGLNEEIVAAMASNTIQAIRKNFKILGRNKFDRLILMSAHGRIVFVDIDLACLLVVTDRNINIDWTLLEIDGVAHRLKNSWKIE